MQIVLFLFVSFFWLESEQDESDAWAEVMFLKNSLK